VEHGPWEDQASYLTAPGMRSRDTDSSPQQEARSAVQVQYFFPNFLLVGSVSQTESALNALRPTLRQPLLEGTCGRPLSLPTHWGTIIVREIANLDLVQQGALLQWLTEHVGRCQLVSVSSTSLFPLVKRGAFLERLYYQLNSVTLIME
jgi:hypothetical protein